MDEYIDGWYIHKTKYDYADEILDNYRKDLKDMVDKDYNHPSVIMYSTGNEVSETAQKKGISLTKSLTDRLHELDSTRPVSCGINIFFNFLSSMGMGVYSDDKAEKSAEIAEQEAKKQEKEKKKPEFSEEELRALQQYLDELPETETPSEEETAELYRKAAEGDYLLLLNNDVEVVNGDWLTELLRQCAHPGGAAICGAMLWYPDETIQHAGIVTGLGGYAGHSHKYKKKGGSGYLFRTSTVQDFSGVTGACLLVKTAVYDEMHGLDEQFAVAFNDVDFCLRVRDAGYRIAWTPYAELIHYESKSRGGDEKDPVKAARFAAEQQRLYTIHGKENILDDPYYNPNLTRDREDFSESDDLRRLKEGRVTVRFRGGTLQ